MNTLSDLSNINDLVLLQFVDEKILVLMVKQTLTIPCLRESNSSSVVFIDNCRSFLSVPKELKNTSIDNCKMCSFM